MGFLERRGRLDPQTRIVRKTSVWIGCQGPSQFELEVVSSARAVLVMLTAGSLESTHQLEAKLHSLSVKHSDSPSMARKMVSEGIADPLARCGMVSSLVVAMCGCRSHRREQRRGPGSHPATDRHRFKDPTPGPTVVY